MQQGRWPDADLEGDDRRGGRHGGTGNRGRRCGAAGHRADARRQRGGVSAGDLDRFMTCYADDPATSYVGSGKLVTGYQAIRAMYASRFGGGSRAAMGMLTIDIDSLRLIADDAAYVVGRFHLRRPAADGGDVTGLTTLVFRRQADRWLIVADHS